MGCFILDELVGSPPKVPTEIFGDRWCGIFRSRMAFLTPNRHSTSVGALKIMCIVDANTCKEIFVRMRRDEKLVYIVEKTMEFSSSNWQH